MASTAAHADEAPAPALEAEPEAEPATLAVAPEAEEPPPAATSSVFAEPAESSATPQELIVAPFEPPPVHPHEPAPEVPSAEVAVPLAAEAAPHPAEHPFDPEPEPVAPIETAPAEAAAAEAAPEPVPTAAAAPIDAEKVAQEALASNLADMIQTVLSTKQFATRAKKADRYSPVQPVQAIAEPEPEEDLGDESEIEAEALPHPVAIRARLGRMERALALLSLGMMILVGYFAISLWRDDNVVAAQAPVTAPALSSSSDRGTVTREFGGAAIETSKTSAGPGSGERRPGDRR